ncbi:uncharacterized protein NPIL_49141 [Nephila pilipes]|uniref:MULE transposase domain-containing protein n=1 Tax=Nephila pilipes TaxID=299642 RepID=A0A8X6IBA9_NEPPI|nr:uncharacterized protein NPIL_49141 [Nephila pilipes]
MCGEKFRLTVNLNEHLQNVHHVELKFAHENFYSEEDFLQWKEKIQVKSVSSFKIRNTCEKEAGLKLTYYICHRSRVSNPISNRIRHAKALGSVKCGFACPAMMTVSRRSIDGVTEITVQYQSVHVGHDMEPGKIHLTKDERSALASSLEQGIPMAKILDETREAYSPGQRFGLTTRKDLHNICRDYKIGKTGVLHSDDATSVTLMVKNMQDIPHDPILIFKPVGDEMNGYKKIGTEEFMLAIMNDTQEKLLELYGKQCVMIDSTHGTNQYGFQMTTLMVHDENHQGMPVAILFSSRVATEILVPFFGAIKKKVPSFKTNFLLSDDTNSFPNAWREVFGDETKHLLCAWHVMRNWNLNINSKVVQYKEEIRIKLKIFLAETDETSFHKLISSFIETYEAKESSFVAYFQNENYNEKHEIEKDAIVPTLHNVSLDAAIHNTLTVMKNLERGLRNVKSVDEVCEIQRTLIALERRVNSSESMTNLSGLPVAQRKVAWAPSYKSIEQQRRFVIKKRKLSKQNRSCQTDVQKHQKQE